MLLIFVFCMCFCGRGCIFGRILARTAKMLANLFAYASFGWVSTRREPKGLQAELGYPLNYAPSSMMTPPFPLHSKPRASLLFSLAIGSFEFHSATAAVMLAQSRRTRPCGCHCATAAAMLAQSRRTRPCGFRCATTVVMLAQSRCTRPCRFLSLCPTVAPVC